MVMAGRCLYAYRVVYFVVEQVVESETFGPLTAELRGADAHHHNLNSPLPAPVTGREFGDADDIGAILRHRLQRATTNHAWGGRETNAVQTSRLIAGLIPETTGPMTPDVPVALNERKNAARTSRQHDGRN